MNDEFSEPFQQFIIHHPLFIISRFKETSMIVGVPKEVKDNEYRVGLVPAGVKALTDAGHKVIVQKSAGDGSGIMDEEFVRAGGEILDTAEEVWAGANMVVKV